MKIEPHSLQSDFNILVQGEVRISTTHSSNSPIRVYHYFEHRIAIHANLKVLPNYAQGAKVGTCFWAVPCTKCKKTCTAYKYGDSFTYGDGNKRIILKVGATFVLTGPSKGYIFCSQHCADLFKLYPVEGE